MITRTKSNIVFLAAKRIFDRPGKIELNQIFCGDDLTHYEVVIGSSKLSNKKLTELCISIVDHLIEKSGI